VGERWSGLSARDAQLFRRLYNRYQDNFLAHGFNINDYFIKKLNGYDETLRDINPMRPSK
jgi:hypothetical protein